MLEGLASAMAEPDGNLQDPEIPNKLYFRIGDVSRLVGVRPYVLRYWESEFPALAPKKSGTGHRLYRRKDVELLLEIKRLLYEKRFTIEGARAELVGANKRRPRRQSQAAGGQGDLFGPGPETLDRIRAELLQILELLR
jgi:DNA-binding transcriptional MerR regulator